MATKDTAARPAQASVNMPGPDVMLRLWASWMDQMSAPAKALADPGTAWWQMTTRQPASQPHRRRCRSAPEEPVTGSDTPLHRPDVERQSAARGRARRLGRDRPGLARRLAALAEKAQHSFGRHGPQSGPVALRA